MKTFQFDGRARDFFFIGLAAFIISVITLGFGFPWAIVMVHKWRARHTLLEGKRLNFKGQGSALFGKYIIWYILTFITLGIYSIAVYPRFQKWIAENTVYEL